MSEPQCHRDRASGLHGLIGGDQRDLNLRERGGGEERDEEGQQEQGGAEEHGMS